MPNSHPEQVRKARDAGSARTELRSPLIDEIEDAGTSSPATRPESPMSTAENADWSYARREAVVARLNGANVNLDELRDEDLNQLYSSILKVRHSRTASSVASGDRPESRMSYMESVTEDEDDEDDYSSNSPWNRPFSGSTWSTEPTSIGDSTMTLSHPPEVEERLQAVKLEYEERIKTMTESAAEVDEVKAEKQQMQAKLKSLETQMRRYERREKGKKGVAEDDDYWDAPPLTPEQEKLARGVIAKWRTMRKVRMAEDALSQAVAIKEANVLSRELKKGASFQFVVVERDVPTSASEVIAGLGDIEEPSDPALLASPKPCIGVKVLDRRNRAIYVWSLSKLQQRLQQMRNLHQWVDKPEYAQHFAWQDPFYDSPSLPGGYSFVGSAFVSLAPLSRNLPSTSIIPIYSPYTADPLGTCQIRLKPISVSSPDSPSTPIGHGSHPSLSPFLEGSTLTFEVTVERVAGLTKADFSTVHLQIHRSSFLGSSPSIEAEDALASQAVDLDRGPSSDIKLQQTITVVLTADVQRHLSEAYAPIEVLARITSAHLDKIERWDEARDSSITSKIANMDPLRGDPLNGDVTRRPENELISEQRHDVVASVEVRELGEGGEYIPVQVVSSNSLDSGAFFLRQGLQRRFVLNLSHNSGRGWQWKRITKVSLGNVRMLDHRGRIHAATSAADVELRGMGKPRAVFTSDGTATLTFAAAWDSSVHDSPHLNRNTPANQRALVHLSFEVTADNCATPVAFDMDIAVTVQSRDARAPSKLMSLLSSSRLSSCITSVFAVRLTPIMTKNPTDLWRLDTAEKYVRGEEALAGWKPRGLSLVRDYEQVTLGKRSAADVEAAKAVFAAFELTLPSAVQGLSREEKLASVIELWKKHFGTREEVSCPASLSTWLC